VWYFNGQEVRKQASYYFSLIYDVKRLLIIMIHNLNCKYEKVKIIFNIQLRIQQL